MSFSSSPLEEARKVQDKIVDGRDKKTIKKVELNEYHQWWLAKNDKDLCTQLLSTTAFLKVHHTSRIRQASLYSRLYCGKPLYNYLANNSTLDSSSQMPMGRPTANVVYSCIDTITSKITQDEPTPVFLTDAGHYKERRLAKEFNSFIMGEFYRTQAHAKGAEVFRDAALLGSGFLKIIEKDKKVALERTLETELLVDFNDGYYGSPRALIHTKLCDRGILADEMPKNRDKIFAALEGIVDNSMQSTESIADQIVTAEGWHLPSGEGATDGRHVIVCTEGVLLDEPWPYDYFPFSKLDYNKNTVGYFSQGMAEILFPGQMEIYKMLIIASQAIEMLGVPRVVISEMSKVAETAFNNNIMTLIKVKTMAEAPQFINATSNNAEIYTYIKWLIDNAYQISGISAMSASGQKEPGVTSGEAMRTLDDVQSERFAALQKRYQNFYVDLAYKMIDRAAAICKREGTYTSVYPGKDGTREVDLPKVGMLKDTYVIRCEEESALPKDPAGRQAKISEQLAAGEITIQEFRRLSNFPDLEQTDQLALALEERILHDLDQIVEKGEKGYLQPDAFILDPTDMATTITVQTFNKYVVTDIEKEKLQLIRNYFTAVQILKQKASQSSPQPPQPGAPAPPSMAPTPPPPNQSSP